MINLTRSAHGAVIVDSPSLKGELSELIQLGLATCGFLLPVGKKMSGKEFSQVITRNYDNPQAEAVAAAFECVDKMPAHYVSFVRPDEEDDVNHRAVAWNGLADKVMESFKDHRRGFLFTFVNDDGKRAMGVVFGSTADTAYHQVKRLKEFRTPADCGDDRGFSIHCGMTHVQVKGVFQEVFFTMPILNYRG